MSSRDAGTTGEPDSGERLGQRDAGDAARPAPDDVFDVDAAALPRFLGHDVIELGKIARVSRFRSGIGHDYADHVESCRSMKHYFQPRSGIDWASVRITAPAAGTLVRIDEEWAGKQLHLKTDDFPAFTIVIFHVQLDATLVVGAHVAAGQALGTHVGSQTMSDVAVRVNARDGLRMVSYFALVTDDVMAGYRARGVSGPEALIIDRAERDAAPLTCSGEQFATSGTLENWVTLD